MGVENRRMKTSRDDDGEKEKDERMGGQEKDCLNNIITMHII